MSAEQLTEREQQFLEHLHRAQELDVSLAEYARSFDLDVKELYNGKRTLVHKGVLAGRPNSEDSDPVPMAAGDFVPVRVTARPAPAPSTAVCRIHHPSGLMIECTSFPPSSWLAMLLSRARDVPA
jgi:hypothetical protein